MERKRNRHAKQDREFANLSPLEKLAWIHERMAGVTEEEVMEALLADEASGDIDKEALEAYLATLPEEERRRLGYASMPTS